MPSKPSGKPRQPTWWDKLEFDPRIRPYCSRITSNVSKRKAYLFYSDPTDGTHNRAITYPHLYWKPFFFFLSSWVDAFFMEKLSMFSYWICPMTKQGQDSNPWQLNGRCSNCAMPASYSSSLSTFLILVPISSFKAKLLKTIGSNFSIAGILFVQTNLVMKRRRDFGKHFCPLKPFNYKAEGTVL